MGYFASVSLSADPRWRRDSIYVFGVDGNGIAYMGGSAVYDWEGAALAEAMDDSGTVYLCLDLGALQAHRKQFPAWRDADAFEVIP